MNAGCPQPTCLRGPARLIRPIAMPCATAHWRWPPKVIRPARKRCLSMPSPRNPNGSTGCACWPRCAGWPVMPISLTATGPRRRAPIPRSRGCGWAGSARWHSCVTGRVRRRYSMKRSAIWAKRRRCCRRGCLLQANPARSIIVRSCSTVWARAMTSFCRSRAFDWRCGAGMLRARAILAWPCCAGRRRGRPGVTCPLPGDCWVIRWGTGWKAIRRLCARTMCHCRQRTWPNWPTFCAPCTLRSSLTPNNPCVLARRPIGPCCCGMNRFFRA